MIDNPMNKKWLNFTIKDSKLDLPFQYNGVIIPRDMVYQIAKTAKKKYVIDYINMTVKFYD